MIIPRTRLVALGLATAVGLAAAGWLNAAEPPATKPGGSAPVAEQDKPAGQAAGGNVRVDAPGTQVNVDKERGKVSVTAPHADVRVDPDQGQVKVRAPYVNLDIRW